MQGNKGAQTTNKSGYQPFGRWTPAGCIIVLLLIGRWSPRACQFIVECSFFWSNGAQNSVCCSSESGCLPSRCHSSNTTVAAGSQTQGAYQAISNVHWSGKRPEGVYHESNWQEFFVRIVGTTDRLFECHAISNDDSPPNTVGCIGLCWYQHAHGWVRFCMESSQNPHQVFQSYWQSKEAAGPCKCTDWWVSDDAQSFEML